MINTFGYWDDDDTYDANEPDDGMDLDRSEASRLAIEILRELVHVFEDAGRLEDQLLLVSNLFDIGADVALRATIPAERFDREVVGESIGFPVEKLAALADAAASLRGAK